MYVFLFHSSLPSSVPVPNLFWFNDSLLFHILYNICWYLLLCCILHQSNLLCSILICSTLFHSLLIYSCVFCTSPHDFSNSILLCLLNSVLLSALPVLFVYHLLWCSLSHSAPSHAALLYGGESHAFCWKNNQRSGTGPNMGQHEHWRREVFCAKWSLHFFVVWKTKNLGERKQQAGHDNEWRKSWRNEHFMSRVMQHVWIRTENSYRACFSLWLHMRFLSFSCNGY